MSVQLLVETVIGLLAVSTGSLFALIVADKLKSRQAKRSVSRAADCGSALAV